MLSLHLFHHLFILQIHGCEFLANAIVNFKELSYTSIQAYGFTLTEITLTVLWRNTLLLTGSGHSAREKTPRDRMHPRACCNFAILM